MKLREDHMYTWSEHRTCSIHGRYVALWSHPYMLSFQCLASLVLYIETVDMGRERVLQYSYKAVI